MLKTKIESLLFISNKPLAIKSLVNFLKKQGDAVTSEEVQEIINQLKEKYNLNESGVQLIEAGDGFQFVTNSAISDFVKKFTKEDITGELTPASLETLTVIAYRGPISKVELEQIRGVNCSLIIRNLLIRGLIISRDDKTGLQTYYAVTADFLRHLGLNSVKELPDYEKLHEVENLEEFMKKQEERMKNAS